MRAKKTKRRKEEKKGSAPKRSGTLPEPRGSTSGEVQKIYVSTNFIHHNILIIGLRWHWLHKMLITKCFITECFVTKCSSFFIIIKHWVIIYLSKLLKCSKFQIQTGRSRLYQTSDTTSKDVPYARPKRRGAEKMKRHAQHNKNNTKSY